ncbi:MAG: carboxy-S-adenosyl-L-methionine synthase CmoA [Gammaproteobacteria bacterium]|nr:MAG: carboxy-S-adenosyl-L-methionine synthase CmoA [Gammaproteobacteria bacterium]
MQHPDRLFADPEAPLVDFRFDEAVAAVFPDMIRRSVPGYEDLVRLTGLLAARHARPGTRIYDLGCALGAALLAVRRCLQTPDVELVGVDNAPAMLARARALCAAGEPGPPVRLECRDVTEIPIERASVVILNLTLQFVDPARRLPLLERIRAGLVDGGMLLLAEKVCFANDRTDAFMTAMHEAYKRANGYSETEIARKRAALERVLRPDPPELHEDRLRMAGFTRIEPWYRCLNFAAWAAFR